MELVVDNTGKPIDPNSKLAYALKYAAIGWHVFPVHYAIDGNCSCGVNDCKNAAKHPHGSAPFGQSMATTDAEQIRKWWTRYPDCNIGVLLSKSDLCAIDIDPRNGGHYTIDELETKHGPLDADLLAFTGGGGEHRIYWLPNNLNLPGKLGKGIDVKVNGYILVEPSNHISGGHYVWEASSNPLDGVVAGPLPDWLRDLTRAVHVPEDSLPAAASELTTEEIEEIKDALTYIDSDDRDIWLQVGMAIHNEIGGSLGFDIWSEWSMTSAKFHQHDQLRVWRSFKLKGISGITKATLFKLAYESGFQKISKPLAFEDVVLKDHLDILPGESPKEFPVPILNEIVDWLETLDESPCRQITMQGVIAIVATLASRIYQSTNSNDSSLFLMTLAPTGYGKGYPAKGIKNLFLKSELAHLIKGAGNTSPGAVFSALKESPAHLQISDEIGKQYAAAKKSNNSQLSEAFAQLTQSYSLTDSVMYERNYSTHGLSKADKAAVGNRFVINPSITLYSFATPEQVCDNLSTSEIDDGFLNRMIIVPVEDPQLPERERQRAHAPDRFIEWCKSMRRINKPTPDDNFAIGVDTPYDQEPSPIAVAIDTVANQLFKDFHSRIKRDHEGDMLKMSIRWRENAMRLATGLAAALNQDRPIITKLIAEWSIHYVEFYGKKAFALIQSNVADNDIHRLRNSILHVVEKFGVNGCDYGKLGQFSRVFATTAPSLRDSVLEGMVAEDLIVRVMPDSTGKRGRKSKHGMFYHSNYIAD